MAPAGKVAGQYSAIANKPKSLTPDLAAKVETYIKDFGGTNLDAYLRELNGNGSALDEVVDRLKRTAQSIRKIDLIVLPKGEELKIGNFKALSKSNTAGINNLTAHHMPANSYMQELVKKGILPNYDPDDGLTMLINSVLSDKTARHQRTKTYQFNNMNAAEWSTYKSLPPSEALNFDINNLRDLFIQDGVYNAEIEKALVSFISKTKSKYPNIF